MRATVPLTIKVPKALKRELKKTALCQGLKPSAAARAFIEEGIARNRPGALLGAGAGTARFAVGYNPEAPAIPPRDWSDPRLR